MKKLLVICILIVGIILISGCIDGEKTNSKTSTSSQSSMNETSKETSASPSILIPSPLNNNSSAALLDLSQPELMPGKFEINITSYYFVYMRDNDAIYENSTTHTFDLVEKNYVIYHLSIKNNDTNALNFSINKLQLHTGNQVFTPADPGTIIKSHEWVFSEIENEIRLNDTHMLPHQTLEGIVIFQVDNYTTLFNRSFSLRYNTTPIPSTSYEKSLEALTVAEQFDYSITFDIPPYYNWRDNSYDPPEPEVSYVWTIWGRDYVLYTDYGNSNVWANWVNRTVFESYKKYDEMSLPKQKPGNIPYTDIAYAVKVIPEQDLTVTNQYHIISEKKYKGTHLSVVDDTGEELFNKSIDSSRDDYAGLVILDNQTYRPISENMSQMLIPHATIVHFSFYSTYGWPMSARLTFNNQDIILDEEYNIILARYDNKQIIS
ncbi:MAG: hypothetical protein C5S44_11170 [Candidatus Methanocomedens sp.]|nr:MAG: hypothetical protein C5S44_11170 [ANME-2 cluster archaeon]